MAERPTHRMVPRKLPDGAIKLYPVPVTGETCVIDGRECREVVIRQQEWSILLDVILRQEAKQLDKDASAWAKAHPYRPGDARRKKG